jgi:hypothetical protein
MRHLTLALIGLTFLALTACGGGSGRKTQETFALERAPTVTNAEGVKAAITYYKQSDHYLIIKVNLTNTSKETVMIKNGEGSLLPGFRATIEGQTFQAERKGGSWNPWTGYRPAEGGGSNNLEIPAGITAAMEIRWNFQLSRKDYDWVVTITNLHSGDKKLGDLTIAYPPQAAPAAQPAPAK